jgi:hypothetical protein
MEPITLVLIGVGIFLVLLLFSSKGSSPVTPTKVSTLPPTPPAAQQLSPATQQAVANALSPAVGAAVQQASAVSVPNALKSTGPASTAPAGFRSGPSPLEEAFQSGAPAPAPAGTGSYSMPGTPEQMNAAANMVIDLVNSLLDNTFTLKASEITSIQSVLRTASPPVIIPDDELTRVVRYYLLKQMTPPVETQDEIYKALTKTKPSGNGQIAFAIPANPFTGPAETIQYTVDDLRAMKALTYKWPSKYASLFDELLLKSNGLSLDVNKVMNTFAKLTIWMSGYYFGVNMLS